MTKLINWFRNLFGVDCHDALAFSLAMQTEKVYRLEQRVHKLEQHLAYLQTIVVLKGKPLPNAWAGDVLPPDVPMQHGLLN